MRHALSLACTGDGRLRRGLHFDIHDNNKEDQLSNSVFDSAQSSGSGELAGLGLSTGNQSVSDNASLNNSGNVTSTVSLIDPGTVAASERVSEAAINANAASTQAAAGTLQYAITKVTELAGQVQQGQLITALKPIGFILAGLVGIWALYKIAVGIWGKK